ncbi:hypothetical protein ANCDUO_03174 [Ancylostoma duodenale]|uniref:Uncharacterized protein n=1 Tax=Ancylostoma duodenale TaxID=51022 RepID=A0A0C2DUK6_9BILA|nr:hypothetical protein ANCDUO_03174 [Ancylostoma duodenale]
MFARDIGPDSSSRLSTQNLYGVHPFYICVENDGKAHGVFIFNSNAQSLHVDDFRVFFRKVPGKCRETTAAK